MPERSFLVRKSASQAGVLTCDIHYKVGTDRSTPSVYSKRILFDSSRGYCFQGEETFCFPEVQFLLANHTKPQLRFPAMRPQRSSSAPMATNKPAVQVIPLDQLTTYPMDAPGAGGGAAGAASYSKVDADAAKVFAASTSGGDDVYLQVTLQDDMEEIYQSTDELVAGRKDLTISKTTQDLFDLRGGLDHSGPRQRRGRPSQTESDGQAGPQHVA